MGTEPQETSQVCKGSSDCGEEGSRAHNARLARETNGRLEVGLVPTCAYW